MREAFVKINGVSTKIATWGRWIEEVDPNDPKDLVIFIPGNPGVTRFYNHMAEVIHKNTGYSVWSIGHAGHNLPQRKVTSIPAYTEHPDLYGLKGQVEHKIAFFDKYVPNDAKVHLVGHSIGCYMILELLQNQSVKNKVKKSYLLFPTLEHMAVTENGKFLCNFIKHIVWLIVFLSFIFTVLPGFLQNILLYIYLTIIGVNDKEFHTENIKELIKPGVLRRVFFLAFEEMDQVLARNNKSIKENVNDMKFCYGSNDGWAPLTYCEKLKQDIPDVDCEIVNINHTFVFNQDFTVGNNVAKWINLSKI